MDLEKMSAGIKRHAGKLLSPPGRKIGTSALSSARSAVRGRVAVDSGDINGILVGVQREEGKDEMERPLKSTFCTQVPESIAISDEDGQAQQGKKLVMREEEEEGFFPARSLPTRGCRSRRQRLL
jgi:hypothetical protein